jgi:hypothetical protein
VGVNATLLERGNGKGVGVYATLLQSDTVQKYGLKKADTRSVGSCGGWVAQKTKGPQCK